MPHHLHACNYGYSWLLVLDSQIDILTFNPSFSHNLCFKYSHGSCKPIIDIYVLRVFQWYKEVLNPMSSNLSNCSLKIQKFQRDSNSQSGSPLRNVWAHFSHSFAFLGMWMWFPGYTLRPTPFHALALIVSPRIRSWHPTQVKIDLANNEGKKMYELNYFFQNSWGIF